MGIIAKAEAAAAAAEKPKYPNTLRGKIQRMLDAGEIAKALPSVITPERFTRIVLSAINTNPKLQECTPNSFLGAMMVGAQLGLECNTPLGQAYLIPRWNGKNRCMECTFQTGYQGLIDLFYRNPNAQNVYAQTVYANDVFEYELGIEPKLIHKPAMTNRGDPIAFYAVYHTKDGGYGFECMSIDDVRNHAQKFSESVKKGYSSPWDSNFEEMAKKTVLKKVLKYAPKSTDLARVIAVDDTVHNTISEDMFSEPVEYIDITDTGVADVVEEMAPDPGNLK